MNPRLETGSSLCNSGLESARARGIFLADLADILDNSALAFEQQLLAEPVVIDNASPEPADSADIGGFALELAAAGTDDLADIDISALTEHGDFGGSEVSFFASPISLLPLIRQL